MHRYFSQMNSTEVDNSPWEYDGCHPTPDTHSKKKSSAFLHFPFESSTILVLDPRTPKLKHSNNRTCQRQANTRRLARSNRYAVRDVAKVVQQIPTLKSYGKRLPVPKVHTNSSISNLIFNIRQQRTNRQ